MKTRSKIVEVTDHPDFKYKVVLRTVYTPEWWEFWSSPSEETNVYYLDEIKGWFRSDGSKVGDFRYELSRYLSEHQARKKLGLQ